MTDPHEWRARILRELHDINWNDPSLLALPDDQQDAIERVIEQASQALCQIAGHEPVPDQCGIPDHDLCVWCQTRTPGQAARS